MRGAAKVSRVAHEHEPFVPERKCSAGFVKIGSTAFASRTMCLRKRFELRGNERG